MQGLRFATGRIHPENFLEEILKEEIHRDDAIRNMESNVINPLAKLYVGLKKKNKQGNKKCKWFELVMKKQLIRFQKASPMMFTRNTQT